MTKFRDVVAVLDAQYDPRWAEDWDAVGTVAGDPDAEVKRILLAVDPVKTVADEAVSLGADLIVTHHPLFLKGVTSVAATTPKGRLIHTLLTNGIGLHTCHTNADSPVRGVSESMAFALGLNDVEPLESDPEEPVDKWTVFVPLDSVALVRAAMHDAGGGAIGDYIDSSFEVQGTGAFRPTEGTNPTIGEIGQLERVDEIRLEMVAQRSRRKQIEVAIKAAHPYEEVAFEVIELAPRHGARGSGRIGRLAQPMTLRDFAAHVAGSLPSHHSATRVAGDPDRVVETVALCGGSGDFLLGTAAAAGADVYVTSDLRHHPVSEHIESPGSPAVIDVPHWAAEWTWLPVAANVLSERLGDTVEITVSKIVTDPWTFLAPSGLRSHL